MAYITAYAIQLAWPYDEPVALVYDAGLISM